MSSEDPLENLSKLTERQLEVLRLVCQGVKYKEIGARLVISESTVKSTMYQIYIKLGLDSVDPGPRKILLHQAYCRALTEEIITTTMEESEEPVSEEVIMMVEEDEKALVPYKPKPTQVVEVITSPPHPDPPRIPWVLLVAGIIIGFVLWKVWDGNGSPTPVAEALTEGALLEITDSEIKPSSVEPLTTEVVIIVTDTPGPATPTPQGPTNTPKPTSTRRPTVTPTPVGMNKQTIVLAGKEANYGGLVQTDIWLQQGDYVSIQYLSGEWWIGQDVDGKWSSQEPTDADGYTDRDGERATALVSGSPDRCKVIPGLPYGSLIGRVGDPGPSFLIGNSLEIESSADGLLYLGINYVSHNYKNNCPYGNGGEITVSIQVIPR